MLMSMVLESARIDVTVRCPHDSSDKVYIVEQIRISYSLKKKQNSLTSWYCKAVQMSATYLIHNIPSENQWKVISVPLLTLNAPLP